ncbi:hypothetical protein GCM10009739_10900 [Microbacterium ulmi]
MSRVGLPDAFSREGRIRMDPALFASADVIRRLSPFTRAECGDRMAEAAWSRRRQLCRGGLMGIDDIVSKGKELFEGAKDKVTDALGSDKVEEVSDKVLDGAADAAKKVAPDQYDAKIDEVRDNIDGAIGE